MTLTPARYLLSYESVIVSDPLASPGATTRVLTPRQGAATDQIFCVPAFGWVQAVSGSCMALPRRPCCWRRLFPRSGSGRALGSLGLTGYDLPCMMAETFTLCSESGHGRAKTADSPSACIRMEALAMGPLSVYASRTVSDEA
jgi:hypothetical protein